MKWPFILFYTFLFAHSLLSCQKSNSRLSSSPSSDSITSHTVIPHPSDTLPSHSSIPDNAPDALTEEQQKALIKKTSESQITYFVIKVPDQKFGYSIYLNGNLYIEQKSIPAIEGNVGFSSEADAEKIAKLIVEKIKRGDIPPTITANDLTQQGIIE